MDYPRPHEPELDPTLHKLESRLEAPDGRATAAELAELSVFGASVRLPQALGAKQPGDELDLVLCAPELDRSIRVPARIRHVVALRDHYRYALEFPQSTWLQQELPSRPDRLFDVRAAPRAVIDPTVPISVRVSRSDRPDAWARLIDISTTGMAVHFAAHDDPELVSGELVTISYQLGSETLKLVERVRHGVLDADSVRYGLQFEGALTPQFERQSDVIERFVQGATRIVRCAERIRGPRLGSANARRVKPGPQELVPVQLAAALRAKTPLVGITPRLCQARLRDISLSGIGVMLPAALDPGFRPGERAVLSCDLAYDATLNVAARVRRSLLIDDEVCYGLEFDRTHTRDFERKYELIGRFVDAHRAS